MKCEDRSRPLAGVVISAGAIFGFRIYRDKLTVILPDYPPIRKAIGLRRAGPRNSGNGSIMPTRARRPSTSPTNGSLRWSSHGSPSGDVGRLSDPAYLDRYGFIPGATKGGEIHFRSGSRGGRPCAPNGEPWLNPRTNEPMTRPWIHLRGLPYGPADLRRPTLLSTAARR